MKERCLLFFGDSTKLLKILDTIFRYKTMIRKIIRGEARNLHSRITIIPYYDVKEVITLLYQRSLSSALEKG